MQITFVDKSKIKSIIDMDSVKDFTYYAYTWFMENDDEVIYVTKQDKLYELISIGDVFRYFEGVNTDVINTRFTVLYIGEIAKAKNFLSLIGQSMSCLLLIKMDSLRDYMQFLDRLLAGINSECG